MSSAWVWRLVDNAAPLHSSGSGRARSAASTLSGRRRRTEVLASVRRSN